MVKKVALDLENDSLAVDEKINDWFSRARKHLSIIPSRTKHRIQLLSLLRKDLYEDLNQLQHSAAIIEAAKSLQIEFINVDSWSWHPRQTSHPDFADLTGYVEKKVFLNAEITTSLNPVGTIDSHMAATLTSLSKKSGLRFYFVLTDAMFKRASAKINKGAYKIQVRKLD